MSHHCSVDFQRFRNPPFPYYLRRRSWHGPNILHGLTLSLYHDLSRLWSTRECYELRGIDSIPNIVVYERGAKVKRVRPPHFIQSLALSNCLEIIDEEKRRPRGYLSPSSWVRMHYRLKMHSSMNVIQNLLLYFFSRHQRKADLDRFLNRIQSLPESSFLLSFLLNFPLLFSRHFHNAVLSLVE